MNIDDHKNDVFTKNDRLNKNNEVIKNDKLNKNDEIIKNDKLNKDHEFIRYDELNKNNEILRNNELNNNTILNRNIMLNENKAHKEKKKKRIPLPGVIVIDILLTGICLCIFALFHHVLPQRLNSENKTITTIDDQGNNFELPSDTNESTDVNNSSADDSNDNSSADDSNNNTNANDNSNSVDSNTSTADNSSNNTNSRNNFNGSSRKGLGFSNENTTDIASDDSESTSISAEDKSEVEVNQYKSEHIALNTNKVEIGSGSNKITYYVSDIYVTNVKYLKSAFATGEYGKNLREAVTDMAEENDAILAISGDFYGNSEEGVVIRNGVLYRSELSDTDICVLFKDGTMKTYSPDEFNADEVIKQGAWQAWNFGPALLDGNGNILKSFNTTSYIDSSNPRCAIGYVGEGHYVFVVVDGRNEGYSRGASLSELAQIMIDEGCKTAYNLDGGKSAAMVYQDQYVNQPADGGRTISDIIYLGE